MSDWQAITPYGTAQPGSPVSGGGGRNSYTVGTRDNLDGLRMGGKTPEAQYPDGYLGTIRSRREDRLLDAVKSKIGDRSYQRGVHKGIQIDSGDYFWPQELQPTRGLELQAKGIRNAPIQTTTEQILYGRGLPRGAESLVGPLPGEVSERAPELSRLLPGWR